MAEPSDVAVAGGGPSEGGDVIRGYFERRDFGDPDVEDWDAFYRKFGPLIRTMARVHGRPWDDPDDAAQDIWTRLIRQLGRSQFDPRRGPFDAWLRVLARNVLANRSRRIGRRPVEGLEPSDADRLPGREPDPLAALDHALARDLVREALAELQAEISPVSYQVVYLRCVEERPVAEVADHLDLTPNVVWTRQHRAMAKFRVILDRRVPTGELGHDGASAPRSPV